jgi:hypothetical protein
VYRPPPSKRNELTASEFFREFQEFLSQLNASTAGEICIMGDFNIHLDQLDSTHARQFEDLLGELGLLQHVKEPTHRAGHILDLVITRKDSHDEFICDLTVYDIDLSDHYAVEFQLSVQPRSLPRITRKIRSFKAVSIDHLACDLESALSGIEGTTDINEFLNEMDKAILNVLDTHAPLRTITLKGHNIKPWYNDSINEARKKRRQLERKWKKTKLVIHRDMLKEQSIVVVEMINSSKRAYYNNKLLSADCKETFKVINGLMSYNPGCPLPPASSEIELCDKFVNFFHEKVRLIVQNLGSASSTSPVDNDILPQDFPFLREFQAQTAADITKVIKNLATKSCSLDSIATSILKEKKVLQVLLPFIMNVVNLSLSSGTFPEKLKLAHVSPYLKKNGLDVNVLNNYRPVSNIPFLSKVIEKVVAKQLTSHLTENGLHDPMQSAYKQGSSTETALIRIKADMEDILDDGDGILLILLDLSAAFDTINHAILLGRLEHEVGLQATALKWMKSYLEDRRQAVRMNNSVHLT